MINKSIRIIIDTNLWISFLINKDLKKLDQLILHEKIKIVFSQELIEEIIEVINRPKLRRYFHKNDQHLLLELFDTYGVLIEVHSYINKCRDKKDNFLLSLAKDAKADYLITGDDNLLSMKKFLKTEIVSYQGFIRKLIL